MRRITALIALLLAFTLVAAACGGDDDDSVVSGDDPQGLPVNDGDEPPAEDPQNEPGDSDEPIPVEPDNGIGDGAQPLPDEPLGAGPYPIADLTVTYEHPDAGTVEYQIVCLGDTATLIGGADGVTDQGACTRLADGAVQQRLVAGAPADQICTEQYGGPDIARVVGTIDDQPVDTTFDRANGCGIDDWDRLMAGVLANPLGITE